MLMKGKKMKGKPWVGRGRGRGGDQGMEDMAPVRISLNSESYNDIQLKNNCKCFVFKCILNNNVWIASYSPASLADAINNQTKTEVVCIFCLTGRKNLFWFSEEKADYEQGVHQPAHG